MRFLSDPPSVSIDNDGNILSLEKVDGDGMLRDVVKGTTLRLLHGPHAATLTPDGTKLLTVRPTTQAGHNALLVTRVGGGEIGRVLFKLPVTTVKGRKRSYSAPVWVGRLEVSADGKRALIVAANTVFVVSLDPLRLERSTKLPSDAIEAFSGDGSRALVRKLPKRDKHVYGMLGVLASINRSGVLELVDLHSGRVLHSFGTDKKPFEYSDVALSFDGRRAYVGKRNGVDMLDTKTGKLRPLVRFPGPGLGGLMVGRGRLLVSADDRQLTYQQHGVRLVDTSTGSVQKLPDDAQPLAFSPNGKLLLYRVAQAALVRGRSYHLPQGHRHPVTALAFIDRGRILASAGGSLRLWDPRTGAPLGSSVLYSRGEQLAASTNGERLAIAGRDLEIAQTPQDKLLRIGAPHRVSALVFAPDGDLIAATHKGYGYGGFRRSKRLRLRSDRTLFRVSPAGQVLASADVGEARALAVASDSKRVAVYTGRYDPGGARVELVDTKTLRQRTTLPKLDGYGESLAFAGKGTLIAADSSHGAVALDLAQHRLTRRFWLGDCCGTIAVSPDGKLLAAAADSDVQLWDIATRKLRGVFRGHAGDVNALAFSPDGSRLASAGRDTSVLVWNIADVPPAPKPPAPTIDRPMASSLGALARGRFGERIAVLSHGALQSPGEKLPQLPSGLLAVSRGPSASCAITSKRGVVCWGIRAGGVLGYAPKSKKPLQKPQPVPGVANARHIAVGLMYACAIDGAGKLSCWGSLGGTIAHAQPAALPMPGPVRDVAIGLAHACALLFDGRVMCWGDNPAGQLGVGGVPYARSPKAVPGISDATAMAVGDQHTCALRATGAVLCWGNNRSDQLGDGTGLDRNAPAIVRGLPAARALSANGSASCALGVDGRVRCWGRLSGFGASEVHLLAPTLVDALGKASKLGMIAGSVCVDGGGPLRCARYPRR